MKKRVLALVFALATAGIMLIANFNASGSSKLINNSPPNGFAILGEKKISLVNPEVSLVEFDPASPDGFPIAQSIMAKLRVHLGASVSSGYDHTDTVLIFISAGSHYGPHGGDLLERLSDVDVINRDLKVSGLRIEQDGNTYGLQKWITLPDPVAPRVSPTALRITYYFRKQSGRTDVQLECSNSPAETALCEVNFHPADDMKANIKALFERRELANWEAIRSVSRDFVLSLEVK